MTEDALYSQSEWGLANQLSTGIWWQVTAKDLVTESHFARPRIMQYILIVTHIVGQIYTT